MAGIDGVRAIAVILVVVFHIYAFGSGSPAVFMAGVDLRPWLSTGFVGVNLFFVLSGFLLMLPWTKSYYLNKATPNTLGFYRRRALRIMPAYYVHLFVLFLVLVPIAYSVSSVFSRTGITMVLAHFTFTQYLFPQTSNGFGINGALWTLTIEAAFYLVLPFVARFFLGRKTLVGLFVALLVTQGWLYLSFHDLYDFAMFVMSKSSLSDYDSLTIKMFLALQFPGQVFYFAVGMAITNFFFQTSTVDDSSTPAEMLASVLALLSIAGLFWIMWLIARIDLWNTIWIYLWHVIAAFVLGALVLCATVSSSVARRLLGGRLLRLVGMVSYSIYLWHLPVIYFVKKYLIPSNLGGVEVFHFMLLVCVTLTLLLGCASYIYIELPFLRKREEVSW